MKDNWFEVGTIGTTPIYTQATSKSKHLGKVVTESEMHECKEKLFALLTGLEVQHVSKFINEADIGDYSKLGILMAQKTKKAITAKSTPERGRG